MNVLSAISIIIYTSFFIGARHMLTAERKSILNISASAVLISLGWWSFCNSFFFVAITEEQAWFWHKLGAIGWCGFVALTAYYFLALTNCNGKITQWWKQVLFFMPPIVLICRNLFGKTTSLAQNMIKSTNGWGWTYENSIDSLWLWVYLIYVFLYFGFAFYLLHQWAKSVKHKMKKDMAILFIVLDGITILCGVITDVILPLTNPVLPALASIATAIFGVGYFTIIYKNDLFNINLIISSDDILQTSNNSIFVMDENREILKYNHGASTLLGYDKGELMGTDFMSLAAEPIDFSQLGTGGDIMNLEAKLRCKDGTEKYSLLSASIASDKQQRFLCIIVSCQDISTQKKVQDELEVERMKYKQLADDYQKLAYYDPLTGLPNRRHFHVRLKDFEENYNVKKLDFAVIFLDLDNFKHSNDVYGHNGGDELLITAANKLKRCVKKNEFVSRQGGDEFMIIMSCIDVESVQCKIEKIRKEFHKSFLFRGEPYEIGISAGYSIFSQVEDGTELVKKADEAMYEDKKRPL